MNGRNKRTVWTVTTQPYKGAHFAVFPEKLIEPCILAGTSDRGCCIKCGAPWQRVTARIDQGYDGERYGERAVAATGGALNGGTAKSTLGSSGGKLTGRSETVGWQPGCKCVSGSPVPSVVLDPFAGAGTVGVVCVKYFRKFIGIELKSEYCEMAEKRIQAARDEIPLLLGDDCG